MTRRTIAEWAAVGVARALFAVGYAWPGSQFFGRTVIAGDNPREIALTYDDGPNDPYTLRLLEILAHHNVRATFFLIGTFVRQRPEITRQIRAAGHLVGNHTMTHPVLLRESPQGVREQLAGCNAAIEDATGESVRFFRPPHGVRCPDILRAAGELGLTPVMWNATGRDWTALSPEEILHRLERKVRINLRRKKGSNILLHDGGQDHLGVNRGPTLEVTRRLLESWSKTDRQFVTVEKWAAKVS